MTMNPDLYEAYSVVLMAVGGIVLGVLAFFVGCFAFSLFLDLIFAIIDGILCLVALIGECLWHLIKKGARWVSRGVVRNATKDSYSVWAKRTSVEDADEN